MTRIDTKQIMADIRANRERLAGCRVHRFPCGTPDRIMGGPDDWEQGSPSEIEIREIREGREVIHPDNWEHRGFTDRRLESVREVIEAHLDTMSYDDDTEYDRRKERDL